MHAVIANVYISRMHIKNKPTSSSSASDRIRIALNERRTQLTVTHPMWSVLVAFLLSIGASRVVATTIVISRTETEIIVGADSMATSGNTHLPTACKIRRCGDRSFVALAGTVMFPSMDEDVSILGFLLQACAANTVDMRADRFAALVINSVQRSVDYQRGLVDNWGPVVTAQLVIQAVFFGFEDETPTVAIRYFFLESDGSVRAESEAPLSRRPGFIVLGMSDAIDKYRSEHPEVLFASYTMSHIADFIAIQAKATPDQVGGPVDIVRITQRGPVWDQCKNECTEQCEGATQPTWWRRLWRTLTGKR